MTTLWIYLILSGQTYELDLQKLQSLSRHKKAKVISLYKQIPSLRHTFLKPLTSSHLRHRQTKYLNFPYTSLFNLHSIDGWVFSILLDLRFFWINVSHAIHHFSFIFLRFNKPFLSQLLKLGLKFQIWCPFIALLHLFELKL